MKKFENYVSNLRVLEQANKEDLNNEFIISGIVDKFSIQFELGWKLLRKQDFRNGFTKRHYQRSLHRVSFL